MKNNAAYVLDEKAQEHLKNATNAFCQASSLLEMVQQAKEDDPDLFSALNGILALMNNGLNNLGEI